MALAHLRMYNLRASCLRLSLVSGLVSLMDEVTLTSLPLMCASPSSLQNPERWESPLTAERPEREEDDPEWELPPLTLPPSGALSSSSSSSLSSLALMRD
eukprot:CAMPEP_0196172254 /NCGR_PEP_ID=MMETSP0911-20130528/5999_1 /TAXON_ID=49265 /ORGANISM="Thalassiosira rotula, Strain GSO102" /LENGTH=99 /DNA_ID=CAMNT_0041439223 /DNA_START=80 /DNA_END=376 /DNA_ORIENTATION=+